MSQISELRDAIVRLFQGKSDAAAVVSADAQKVLASLEKVAAGIGGMAKDAPGLAEDALALVADASALIASGGTSLPSYIAGAQAIAKTANDLSQMVADFRAQTAVAIVASTSEPPAAPVTIPSPQ